MLRVKITDTSLRGQWVKPYQESNQMRAVYSRESGRLEKLHNFNSLDPGIYSRNLISRIDILSTSCEIYPKWIPQGLIDD